MHDGDPPDLHARWPESADQTALARDWITVWQSELSAAAADREVQEAWQTLAAVWAGAAAALLRGLPRSADAGDAAPPSGSRSRTAAAPRPASAAAAPDARDAEIDRLAGRVADLERRLAELERQP